MPWVISQAKMLQACKSLFLPNPSYTSRSVIVLVRTVVLQSVDYSTPTTTKPTLLHVFMKQILYEKWEWNQRRNKDKRRSNWF